MDNQTVPAILLKFADLLGIEVNNNRVDVPGKFGRGYCCGFVFNQHIRMIIGNYELKEDLMIENPEVNAAGRMIFFKFQHIFSDDEAETNLVQAPSVLIATSRLNTDEVIAIHSNTATINIEVDADYLNDVLGPADRSPVLQSLLQNTRPLLFEQLVYPSLQNIVDEIISGQTGDAFNLFLLRIKAEELICKLLIELEKRDEKQLYPLNNKDIQAIYGVKEQILKHPEKPPVINNLSAFAGMSPTKLKRLFKQIFGDSIFSYYQNFRMKEAARMLTAEKLSVSDTGYRLGFTNLSHFARVFNTHYGVNPKQYSKH